MTIIVGRAADFSQIDLENYNGRITFIPSGPGIRTGENLVLATRAITVELGLGGEFSVNLTSTVAVAPDRFYKIRLDWFQTDPLGLLVPVGMDILPFEIRVPSSTSTLNITDLMERPLGRGEIWVTDDGVPPAGAARGDLVWNTTTDDIRQID